MSPATPTISPHSTLLPPARAMRRPTGLSPPKRPRAMAGFGSLAPRDQVLAGLGQAEEGHGVGDAGGRDAGQRFETLQGESLEVRDLLVALVGRCREEQGAGDQVAGLPAVMAVVQLVDAAHEKCGAREQDQ